MTWATKTELASNSVQDLLNKMDVRWEEAAAVAEDLAPWRQRGTKCIMDTGCTKDQGFVNLCDV